MLKWSQTCSGRMIVDNEVVEDTKVVVDTNVVVDINVVVIRYDLLTRRTHFSICFPESDSAAAWRAFTAPFSPKPVDWPASSISR